MINWILQQNLTNPQVLARIKGALSRADEYWEELTLIPFSTELPPLTHPEWQNIVYGSTTLMFNAYATPAYRSAVFFDPLRFQMQNYLRQWGSHLLNADGQLLAFKDLSEISSPLDQSWFVRPNHDSKLFSGQVATFQELRSWQSEILALELPDWNGTTEIWLAPAKPIEKEWRAFIVDGKIVSASRYLVRGKLAESQADLPPAMIAFAQQMVDHYQPAEVFAIDIAWSEGRFQIIECNCFNGTGFYQHDIEAVIRAVNELVRKKSAI